MVLRAWPTNNKSLLEQGMFENIDLQFAYLIFRFVPCSIVSFWSLVPHGFLAPRAGRTDSEAVSSSWRLSYFPIDIQIVKCNRNLAG
jgi:hypothetical protein